MRYLCDCGQHPLAEEALHDEGVPEDLCLRLVPGVCHESGELRVRDLVHVQEEVVHPHPARGALPVGGEHGTVRPHGEGAAGDSHHLVGAQLK